MSRDQIKELVATRKEYARHLLAMALEDTLENAEKRLFHDPKWQAVYTQARQDFTALFIK